MSIIKQITFLIFSFCSLALYSQGQIKWTAFEDLNDSLKSNPKKVIIKIETSWCGYCKLMDTKVFKHKSTYKKLNADYYFVRLNAETNSTIVFRNKVFNPAKTKRGKHELAIALNGVGNSISYPTIIVLNGNLEIENRLNGYLKRKHFFLWLRS